MGFGNEINWCDFGSKSPQMYGLIKMFLVVCPISRVLSAYVLGAFSVRPIWGAGFSY